MVIVKTSDGIVWEPERVAIEIIRDLVQTGKVTVESNFDGPCAEDSGIYRLFDDICDKFGFNKSQITFITTNQLEHHPEYNVVVNSPWLYLRRAQESTLHNKTKVFDEEFKHFGCFIGHGNTERTWIMSQLYKEYKDVSLLTYHYTRDSGYHDSFVGLDRSFHRQQPEFGDIVTLLENSPLVIDEINEMPIVLPTTYNISKIYHKFFVEVVCLTYFSGNTFYVDEKIWRPIINRTPFIVQGPEGFMDNFTNLGFKSFSHWWSEGHNQDPATSQKYGIMGTLERLSKLSVTELSAMYSEMQDVLDHNYHHLMNLTDGDFERLRYVKK